MKLDGSNIQIVYCLFYSVRYEDNILLDIHSTKEKALKKLVELAESDEFEKSNECLYKLGDRTLYIEKEKYYE